MLPDNLIEKAQNIKNKQHKTDAPTDSEISLAIAWFEGKLANYQIFGALFAESHAKSTKGQIVTNRMASYLKYAILNNKVRIVDLSRRISNNNE